MTECDQLCFEIPGFGPRKVAAEFSGRNVSSDGGVLLLRQVDRWLGLTKQVAKVLPDYRDPDRITHSLDLASAHYAQVATTRPPAARMTSPVIQADSSDARNTASGAISVT